MTEIVPSAKPRKIKVASARRQTYSNGEIVPPTAGTIRHDIQAESYRRGASDALRVVMIAAQAALAKHNSQQTPRQSPKGGGHDHR